ncbi:MAG: hypothetical protein CSA50_03005 [Gammaproteobacteria bacterium]|nr:MAG: hypothetical protein CSA50_03005 [Gammaproteobacteria bacterium]
MKHFTCTLSFCLLMVSNTAALSAKITDSTNLIKVSHAFIELIAQDKTSRAYDTLRDYALASNSEFANIKSEAMAKAAQIKAQLGPSTGTALVKKERIENHFEKHTYLIKYGKAALVWEMTFYQANKGWQVMGVSFNTQIANLYRTVN